MARRLVVLDPTSLLGEELVPRLIREFAHLRCQYLHTRPEPEHVLVEVAGEAAVVSPLGDGEELSDAAAVVLTQRVAPEQRDRLAAFLAAHPGLPCLDLANANVLASPPALTPSPGQCQLAFPDPLLLLPTLVLQALAPLSPQWAHCTVLAPVSPWGSEALDELAAQAVARLSGHSPKSKLLPTVLAFDAIPYPDKPAGQLQQQLQGLFPDTEVRLHALLAGVFHAHSLLLTVRLEKPANSQQVGKLLTAQGLTAHRARKLLAPSHAAGRNAQYQLLGEAGEELSLWVVADHVLLAAEAACRALTTLLRAPKEA